jgi:HAE1 family hydrophobic/amphiphilic exporter-1
VAGAVIASTVTTIVVFIPIVYLHGASGELFKDLAWTVTLRTAFVPLRGLDGHSVLYDRLTGRENDRGETESVQFRKYRDYLRKFLGYRWWVIRRCRRLLLIISILLIPLWAPSFCPVPRAGISPYRSSFRGDPARAHRCRSLQPGVPAASD